MVKRLTDGCRANKGNKKVWIQASPGPDATYRPLHLTAPGLRHAGVFIFYRSELHHTGQSARERSRYRYELTLTPL